MGIFELPPKGVPNAKDLEQKPEILQHSTYLREGEPYMAVAKVIPLFNKDNEQKGFKIISLIKINPKKKEKTEELKGNLESFVDEGEQI